MSAVLPREGEGKSRDHDIDIDSIHARKDGSAIIVSLRRGHGSE